MIVIIDHGDSFTFNLLQSVASLGARAVVLQSADTTAEDVEALAPKGLIVASGAGRPETAGNSVELLRRFAGRIPLFGVGLGCHCAAAAFGGAVKASAAAVHGKAEEVEHDGKGLFTGLHLPFVATRYDSAVVDDEALPPDLQVTARFAGGEVAGLRHSGLALEAVQFDPASILTANGRHIVQNFLAMTDKVRAA